MRDPELLLRTVDLFESERLAFHDAHLVASAERTGVGRVASFDRGSDTLPTVEGIAP